LEKLIKRLEVESVESFEGTEASADKWLEMKQEKWDASLVSKGKICVPSFINGIHILTHNTAGGPVLIFSVRRFSRSVGQEGYPPKCRYLIEV
jgi:hypothetical protein